MPKPVPKPMSAKKVTKKCISVFLEPKHYYQLKNIADSNDRSISWQGGSIIKSYFDNLTDSQHN